MSTAIDANLLLYASDAGSRFHERALEVLRSAAEGPDLLYLFWPVVMAYLRIATHPAVFAHPLAPADATANVEQLLVRPHVRAPGEDDGFWNSFRAVSASTTVRGNLVSDAHVVSLMRQYGVRTILSHDRDFHKFTAITVKDPFA